LKRTLPLLLFVCLSILVQQVSAWNTLTDNFDINCQQTAKRLDCNYRPLNQTSRVDIEVKANDIILEASNITSYPSKGETTAILFLVDTSDPNRQNVVEKNKSQIKELLTDLKPHQKAGLASFDKTIRILSPIGTTTFLLSKSLDSLQASGKTTELYRNLIEAIEKLKSTDASRKLIILLSDGQAEDKAYFHSDVIKAARKNSVVINSIGYPRTITLSVALQTIRRLSEETGGDYIETDMNYNLSSDKLNPLINNIDNGGSFSVDLNVLTNNTSTPDKITLTLKTIKAQESIDIPIRIKVVKIPAAKQTLTSANVSNAPTQENLNNKQPIQIVTKQADNQTINLWLWYGLPAAFIIIIIFILITLFLLWNRRPVSVIDTNTDYRLYAYLIADDDKETRYPITRSIWRIGRSKDNELTLDDTSLSRRHAEIQRNINGTFNIIDMNSMNGVYINNEKVGKAELHEGDAIEIGDVFLRFTQHASDYSLEEPTVMQKTKL